MGTLKKYRFLLLCILTLGLAGCEQPERYDNDDEDVLVRKVVLDQTKVKLKEGVSIDLIASVTPQSAANKKIAWKSNNEDVATVEDGRVTAVSEGVATITAMAKDGSNKKAECEVTVIARSPYEVLIEDITIESEELELDLEERVTLYATVSPHYATNTSLEWTSSDEDVVRIVPGYERKAEILAVGGGTAIIKAMATDGSGLYAKCLVTVNAPEPEPEPEPDEVKQKLEAVGIEFVNAIKAETHQNLVEVVDYIASAYEYYDIEDAYYEKLEALVEETGKDDDYLRSINSVKAVAGMAEACLKAAQEGAQFSTRATEIYTFAVQAGLPDLYGRFTPDTYDEEWAYDASVRDRIEVVFSDDKGQEWTATLKGNKKTTTIKVHSLIEDTDNKYYDGKLSNSETYIDEYTYVFDVPEEMTFVVKCGSATVIDMTVNSSLPFELDVDVEQEYNSYYTYNDYYDKYYYNYDEWVDEVVNVEVDYKTLNVDAQMTVNGYEETFKTNVTKSGVTADAGIKIDGRSMLNAKAKVSADFDDFLAAAQRNGEVSPDEVAEMLNSVSMDFDVLGKVQLKASCPNFMEFYKASEQINEVIDYGGSFSEFSDCVADYNDAFDVKLYFDGKSSEVAFVEFETREEYDEWEGEPYYSVYPVVVLTSDDSRHNIEDYFDDEASFSDLIDAVENLLNEFEDLYGGY